MNKLESKDILKQAKNINKSSSNALVKIINTANNDKLNKLNTVFKYSEFAPTKITKANLDKNIKIVTNEVKKLNPKVQDEIIVRYRDILQGFGNINNKFNFWIHYKQINDIVKNNKTALIIHTIQFYNNNNQLINDRTLKLEFTNWNKKVKGDLLNRLILSDNSEIVS